MKMTIDHKFSSLLPESYNGDLSLVNITPRGGGQQHSINIGSLNRGGGQYLYPYLQQLTKLSIPSPPIINHIASVGAEDQLIIN